MAAALMSPPGKRVTSYGFLPYWISDPLALDFDSLTHVAYFRVGLTASGTPTETSGWNAIADDLVAAAHDVGTKVHLTVAVFDETTQNSVLGSATNRANAVSALATLVNERGADGINVDFEGTPYAQKDNLVAFVTALKAEVDEVYVDTPAVDWSGAYDYSSLSEASDGLFIMAYDYHWGGGDPGPVGPLFGGYPWGEYAMDWTLEDYRYWGATDDKLVLGVPMYGREWPAASDAVPGTATGDATSLTIENAIARAAGYPYRFDDTSQTAWAFTEVGQLWYDDYITLETKLKWGVEQGIQGVGYWALGYDGNDPAFWEMVDRVTLIPSDDVDDDTDDSDTGDAGPDPLDTGMTDSDDTDDTDGGDPDVPTTPVGGDEPPSETDEKGGGCAHANTGSTGWHWVTASLLGLLIARRRR